MAATTAPVAQPGAALAPQNQGVLLSQILYFLTAGYSNGWQSFGTSSPWDSKELGQDIGLGLGTPLVGIDNATVTAINPTWAGAAGGLVELTDQFGNIFRVGHVTPTSDLRVGQSVSSETLIGYSAGQPGGQSSGPHIEFQVQPLGSNTTVDPIAWLGGRTNPDTIVKTPVGGPAITTTTGTTTGTTTTPAPSNPKPPTASGAHQAGFGDILIALVLVMLAIVLVVIGFRLLVGDRIQVPPGLMATAAAA